MRRNNNIPENKINSQRLAKYVLRAQKGDRKAMEHVVNETSGYVYYYCLTLLGSEDEANEALQEIYLTLIKKLDTLEKPEAFLGWLKATTSNHCKNTLARKKCYPSFDDENFLCDAEETDEQLIPQKRLEKKEITTAVVSAAKRLPVFQRECVLMYYYHGMNISQIADILGIKEGTVKSRLYNARTAIKAELERLGFGREVLGGFSPLAFITYSLFSDSEKLALPTAVNSFASSIPHIAGVASTAAKTSFAVKTAAGVAAAGILVTGGVAAHTMRQNAYANETQMSSVAKSNESSFVQPTTAPRFSAEELYYSYGFTDEERRTEIKYNPSAPLNSQETKDYIYDRMNNSIDYFNTLQATCYFSDGKSTCYSAYCIQQGDNPKSKMLTYNGDGTPCSYYAFDGRYLQDFNFGNDVSLIGKNEFNPEICSEITKNRSKKYAEELNKFSAAAKSEYNIYEVRDLDPNALLATKSRYRYSEEDGCYVFHSRMNLPQLPMSAYDQYFPQNIAFDFLRDFDGWKIDEKGTMFGRECFMISGGAEGERGYTFEMTVDKETGALLSFNTNGGINVELITTEFTVDGSIDQSEFDDLSNIY